MIDSHQFIVAMRERHVKWTSVARKIERAEIDVMNWMKGISQIPPYIVLTLDAIKHNLEPADEQRMKFFDVSSILTIEPSRVAFWHTTGQYPLAARLAVTAYDYQRENMRTALDASLPDRLPHNLFRTLALIVRAGEYWRVPGGWRARPTVGQPFPKLRPDTPKELIRMGLIKQELKRGHHCLQPTATGKARYYGKGT